MSQLTLSVKLSELKMDREAIIRVEPSLAPQLESYSDAHLQALVYRENRTPTENAFVSAARRAHQNC